MSFTSAFPTSVSIFALQSLVSTENNLFCSGGNDNMIGIWTYDGKLHGKIERKDGEHIHCMMVIRNNRLVTASDSTLRKFLRLPYQK